MKGQTETKFCYATGNPVNTKKVHLMINQPVQITVVLNNFVQSPIQTSELKRSVNFEMSFWCYRLDQNSNKSIVRISALKFFIASLGLPESFLAQYGHSQSEKKWGLRDKYHRSIKVLLGSYYTYWSYYTYCLIFLLTESIISTGRSQ